MSFSWRPNRTEPSPTRSPQMEGQARSQKDMRPANLTNSDPKLSLPKAPFLMIHLPIIEFIPIASCNSGIRWAKFRSFQFVYFCSLLCRNPPRLVSPASKQAVVWGSTDAIVQQLTLPHPSIFGSLVQCIARRKPEQGSQNCPLQRHDARLQLIAHRLGEVE
uniref:WGS project CBMI000000000 data, contig CS3069_c003379 n=1 Tax=Fusarium clavum TaxID=2594811 RepID=A0A090MDM7_9HYPO|nr:unnamed protein product [Fusarium clavum]